MFIFMLFFGIIILFLVDYDNGFRFYATIAFFIGSLTSMLCGFIGMRVAVDNNYKTTLAALESLEEAFKISYKAGSIIGFMTTSIALASLTTLFLVYK